MRDPHTGIDYLARTKTASLLLYLDFDGVLHHEAVYISKREGIYIREPGFELFEWAHFLVSALEPHPCVRIVLSTSWCRQPGFSRACRRLPTPLQQRVIGGTFHRRAHGATFEMRHAFASQARGLQVLDDVRRRRPVDWLALDDAVEDWGSLKIRVGKISAV